MLSSFVPVTSRWPILFLRLYWISLVAIFIGGLAIRFLLPPFPFMDPDTGGYLSPSIHLLATGTHVSTYRNFLYPFFLTCALWIFPNLNALSYIQHIFGIGTAALLIFIFFRFRAFFPSGKFLDWATRLLALVVAYLFLFSPSTIILEHSIRPEALFPTACAFTILAGLEFSRRVFFEKRTDWLSSLWMLLLIICAIGTYYLKPAWGITAATSLLPILLVLVRIPGKWLWKLGLPLLGFTLAFFAFILPEDLQKQNNKNKASFLATTLLCSHAEFLQDIMQRDALRLPPESPKRAHLLRFVQDIQSAISNPSRKRYGLSLNPDDLMYQGALQRLITGLTLVNSNLSFNQFCYSYYFRAWLEHPLAMLKKVFAQLEFFYSPQGVHIYEIGIDFYLQKKYQRIPQLIYDNRYPSWEPLNNYRKSIEKTDFSEEDFYKLPYKTQWLTLLFNNTFLILLVLSLIGVAMVFFKGDHFSSLHPSASLLLYLASFSLASSFTISFIHMMSVARYHFNQIAISLILQGFEILFLAALVQTYFQYLKDKKDKN